MSRPASGDHAIELKAVSKRLGWTWALRDIDLTVSRGSSVVVIGPNGAGKTTLLRLIATLLSPTEGEGEVLGSPLRGGSDQIRRRVGLLSASGHLYGDLSAAENLRFAAWMGGGRADGTRLRSALQKVGLDHVSDRRARELSSGMQKRLVFAMLLLRPIDLVLLDEPYASLDEDGIRMVDDFVSEWREGGRTVVLATHRRGVALRNADRIAVLQAGRLRRFCRPADLDPTDLNPPHSLPRPIEGTAAG